MLLNLFLTKIYLIIISLQVNAMLPCVIYIHFYELEKRRNVDNLQLNVREFKLKTKDWIKLNLQAKVN